MIKRSDMPQIKPRLVSHFIEWLDEQNVRSDLVTVQAKILTPTQDEIHAYRVKEISEQKRIKKTLIISQDYMILDGHHHWKAVLDVDPEAELRAYRIWLLMDRLIALAHLYPKVTYKI